MERFEIDVVVIGAGVVGLATARALARAGREVLLLEAARSIGSGISSRNSEVIHSGLYYPPDSLKAVTCVEGRKLLYDYCARRGIAYRRCGKLVVAPDAVDLTRLEALRRNGEQNGLDDLVLLDETQTRRLEPALSCVGSLLSPSTGILDSHALMVSLLADFEAAGGTLCLDTPAVRGDVRHGLRLETGGHEPARIACRGIVNCAGLAASSVVKTLEGFPEAHRVETHFAKGNYFALSAPPPFRHLVYPLPEPGGLGVHVTLDLSGAVRFGPDVEWIEGADDFAVDQGRRDRFAAAVRRYWPGLPDDALRADYAGIRPKLGGPDAPTADFLIQGPALHGVDGLVNMLGIESPGLTASLALADRAGAALMSG